MKAAVHTLQVLQTGLKAHYAAAIVVAAILLLNADSIWALIENWWQDDNYSHGFLIVPISLWLLYRKRSELTFPAATSGWGIVLFLAGCTGLIIGSAANEFFVTRFSIVLMISGFSLYYMGLENFRRVWFPFFFLLFMIPVPAVIYYSATLPMQLLSSKITVDLLSLLSVPVARSGNIIHLPNFDLEVAEACSGLRGLVTLLSLTALFGHLHMRGKWLPLILFAAAIPIAIATNIIRVFVTSILAYAISTELAEDFLHQLSGTLVFVVALLLVALCGYVLQWIRDRSYSS